MRYIRTLIAAAIILGWSGYSPPSQASEQLHNFYGPLPKKVVSDQQTFVDMYRSHLKVNRIRLVELYNQEYGGRIGRVRNFEDLLAFLGSQNFAVERCKGTVYSFGFYDSGKFEAFPRGCYAGELVLVHRATGVQVFSLLCGNMFQPPPIVYVPPPQHHQAEVSYISKCGIWILYGCRDQQRIVRHWNQTSPFFQRQGGFSGIIPQHD